MATMGDVIRNSFHNSLDEIEQTSGVEAYFDHFEAIKSLVSYFHPWFPECYFADRFIYGLRKDIQPYVISCKPLTVRDAYALACIYEFSRLPSAEECSYVVLDADSIVQLEKISVDRSCNNSNRDDCVEIVEEMVDSYLEEHFKCSCVEENSLIKSNNDSEIVVVIDECYEVPCEGNILNEHLEENAVDDIHQTKEMDIIQISNVSIGKNKKISGLNVAALKSKEGVFSVDAKLDAVDSTFCTANERTYNFSWEPGPWSRYVLNLEDELSNDMSSRSGERFNFRINMEKLSKFFTVYAFKGGTDDMDRSSQLSPYKSKHDPKLQGLSCVMRKKSGGPTLVTVVGSVVGDACKFSVPTNWLIYIETLVCLYTITYFVGQSIVVYVSSSVTILWQIAWTVGDTRGVTTLSARAHVVSASLLLLRQVVFSMEEYQLPADGIFLHGSQNHILNCQSWLRNETAELIFLACDIRFTLSSYLVVMQGTKFVSYAIYPTFYGRLQVYDMAVWTVYTIDSSRLHHRSVQLQGLLYVSFITLLRLSLGKATTLVIYMQLLYALSVPIMRFRILLYDWDNAVCTGVLNFQRYATTFIHRKEEYIATESELLELQTEWVLFSDKSSQQVLRPSNMLAFKGGIADSSGSANNLDVLMWTSKVEVGICYLLDDTIGLQEEFIPLFTRKICALFLGSDVSKNTCHLQQVAASPWGSLHLLLVIFSPVGKSGLRLFRELGLRLCFFNLIPKLNIGSATGVNTLQVIIGTQYGKVFLLCWILNRASLTNLPYTTLIWCYNLGISTLVYHKGLWPLMMISCKDELYSYAIWSACVMQEYAQTTLIEADNSPVGFFLPYIFYKFNLARQMLLGVSYLSSTCTHCAYSTTTSIASVYSFKVLPYEISEQGRTCFTATHKSYSLLCILCSNPGVAGQPDFNDSVAQLVRFDTPVIWRIAWTLYMTARTQRLGLIWLLWIFSHIVFLSLRTRIS